MSEQITIALVGIGGYGATYVAELLDTKNQDQFRFVGAVDPFPNACPRLAELQSRGVPLFPSLENFYEHQSADLVIVSSPLQFHAIQTCLALSRGSNVLCEKPLCATPGDAQKMSDAQAASGKHVAIGYQWSFSKAIRTLKTDILSGTFGRAIRLRTLALWPRDEVYYNRNRWAGRQKDERGNWVLDSPANNACAHFLHNCFYVLGKKIDESIAIKDVAAELYRAYPIENYDTAAIRCHTIDGTEILFIATHAVGKRRGPVIRYQFERATVEFEDGEGAKMIARLADGSVKDYGSPHDDRKRLLWQTIEVIHGQSKPICGIAAASVHTQCIWAAQNSMPEISSFPADLIQSTGVPGQRSMVVSGLAEALTACFETGKLPNEMGLPWAKVPKSVII